MFSYLTRDIKEKGMLHSEVLEIGPSLGVETYDTINCANTRDEKGSVLQFPIQLWSKCQTYASNG